MTLLKKDEFHGSINAAITNLETAARELNQLWDEGEIRLTSTDIKKIEDAMEKLTDEMTRINDVKNLFANIVKTYEVPVPDGFPVRDEQ